MLDACHMDEYRAAIELLDACLVDEVIPPRAKGFRGGLSADCDG